MKINKRTWPLLIVSCLMFTGLAQAHKVTVFAWVEGDGIHTQSKFAGGKKVKNGKIEVFDAGGRLLLTGVTDEVGEFAFKTPRIADLKIVLTAGMGHQNSWALSAEEVGDATLTQTKVAASPQPHAMPAPKETPGPPLSAPVQLGLTAQEIEAIVGHQVQKHLQPVTRMLASAQERKTSLPDILGGIGYILGLVGLGAYVRYRKETRSP